MADGDLERPLPIDDGTVADDELLWRRLVHPSWVVQEGETKRCSSAAFKDRRSDGVSVLRASLTTLEAVAAAFPRDGIAELAASIPRGLGYPVAADPEPDEPAHALILDKAGGKAKGSDPKKMASACRLLRLPESHR